MAGRGEPVCPAAARQPSGREGAVVQLVAGTARSGHPIQHQKVARAHVGRGILRPERIRTGYRTENEARGEGKIRKLMEQICRHRREISRRQTRGDLPPERILRLCHDRMVPLQGFVAVARAGRLCQHPELKHGEPCRATEAHVAHRTHRALDGRACRDWRGACGDMGYGACGARRQTLRPP